MRGALCEALVQAELIAGSGSSDPRERLEQVLTGLPDYAAALSANEDEVSDQTATRDLKALVDAGLLTPEGDKRGRVYTAAGPLKEIREQARASRQPRSPTDPFAAPKVRGDSA
jgi:DNA-binding transcriptional ArsR family regulator